MYKVVHTIGYALAASIMSLAVGCTSTSNRERYEQRHESIGEYRDNGVRIAKVKVASFDEPNLKSVEVNVETFREVGQLSGFASSVTAEYRAIEVACRVAG